MRTRFLAVFLLILIAVLPARAELRLTKRFSVDGEVRYRTELPNLDFLEDTGYNEYSHLRSSLGFRFRTSRDVTLRFKLKESRVLGTTDPVGISSASVEMQESYLEAKKLLGSSLTMRVGRFEMVYGRGKLIGPRTWALHGPNSFDGFRLEKEGETSWFHFGVLKLHEGSMYLIDPADTSLTYSVQDRYLGILAASFANKMLQPIVLIDFDQRLAPGQVDPNMIITGGFYGRHMMGKLAIEVDGYYQTGTYNDRDLASWRAALDLDLRLGGKMRTKMGAGFDITSGGTISSIKDPKKADNTFYAPFSARHMNFGFMDYFTDVPYGLMDTYFRLGMVPFRRVALELVGHNFSYMHVAPVPKKGVGRYSPLGQELDARLRSRLASGLDMTLGYSFFIPSDGYAYASSGLPGQWGYLIYLQMTATL